MARASYLRDGDSGSTEVTFDCDGRQLDLKLVSRLEFGSGAVAMRYEPRK